MQSKLLKIEKPIYYAVSFDGDAASVKRHDTLPEMGHVIEISPREDDGKGNGYYPVRFFVNGCLSSWKTECFEVVKMCTGYSWTDIKVCFTIKDKRGGEIDLMGEHERFNLEEGIVSLMQKWAWCRQFHFTDTLQVYRDRQTLLFVLKFDEAEKWMSEKRFISFKKDVMKIDEYIKSTILSCMECGYTTDIEYLQGVRTELKQKLWDIQLN